jgi:hypothetical protein
MQKAGALAEKTGERAFWQSLQSGSALQPDISVLDSFMFCNFKLDWTIYDFTRLVEFSPTKYANLVRRFNDEKNYDAPPVNFLGYTW